MIRRKEKNRILILWTAAFMLVFQTVLMAQLTADFTASPTSGYAPLDVTFTDQSSGDIQIWSWSFPGGTPSSAFGQGPHTVTYTAPGIYDVSLTVQGAIPPVGGPRPTASERKTEYIEVFPPNRDWGDAPDSENLAMYPTLSGHDGAYHIVSQNIFLGSVMPDAESEAIPNGNATGDDLDNTDDEDGVNVPVLLIGQSVNIEVTTHGTGYLSAWIDWNKNYDWTDSGEQIADVMPFSTDGTHNISVTAPASATLGNTFARFRYNSDDRHLDPDDWGDDGEVEDYQVTVLDEQGLYDFGDAPEGIDGGSYPVLKASGGAYHTYKRGLALGKWVDTESEGQPSSHALDDDNNGNDDEDGVNFGGPFLPGVVRIIHVEVTGAGYVYAWFDWNQDGNWDDTSEKRIHGTWCTTGIHPFAIGCPATASPGLVYARFRITDSQTPLHVDGYGFDGEVEDHVTGIKPLDEYDFGDAPDPTYPTYHVNGGAYHTVSSAVFLGALVDGEPDGQPSFTAMGDDVDGTDDEDGVTFGPLVRGQFADVDVVVGGTDGGVLNAWIDWDGLGTWSDPGENIIVNESLAPGNAHFNVYVPLSAAAGQTKARFRISHSLVQQIKNLPDSRTVDYEAPTVPWDGYGELGEVEDYEITIEEGEDEMDYGDTKAPFPTLLANDGARHHVVWGVHLGASCGSLDIDADGVPGYYSTGDDGDGNDDEDGVTLLTPIVPGQNMQMDIVASVDGYLNAWMDFNGDDDWDDAGEQFYVNKGMNAGHNVKTIPVPVLALISNEARARFRFTSNSVSSPSYTGELMDGEVEDYYYEITDDQQQVNLDFGDAPATGYPTQLVDDGARHVIPAHPILLLGYTIDREFNGIPHPLAQGDDLVMTDDEDGVFHPMIVLPGNLHFWKIYVTGGDGYLNVWFDWNQDGDWADAGEHVVSDQVCHNGVNLVSANVPASAAPGTCIGRYRLSFQSGLSYTGLAPDGEVEDHPIRVWGETDDGTGELDYGDAPDDTTLGYFYPVRLQDDGARHVVSTRIFLGDTIDAEPHGQPSLEADKDDLTDAVDEDGVFVPILVPGETDTMTIKTHIGYGDSAFFHAWFDWNQDGDWLDTLEYVYEYLKLPRGIWKLPVTPPDTAKTGLTFARFRWSTDTTIFYCGGFAWDGEVEDYMIWMDTTLTPVERHPVQAQPGTFLLEQNYPNPFNPETTIEYVLSEPAAVTLSIYDLRGREVVRLIQDRQSAGGYRVKWQGRDWKGMPVATGMYICRLKVDTGNQRHVLVRKMAFVK